MPHLYSVRERDAELAGQIDRGYKSYVAMLAARCVETKVSGARTDLVKSDKVSAAQFATRAGIAGNTVKAYLRTWDAMSEGGRSSMSPGDDV